MFAKLAQCLATEVSIQKRSAFKIAQKVTKSLGDFYKKINKKEISKITQSGYTNSWTNAVF